MAPEVIEPGKFSKELRSGPHTDVYALGVTVFLLFAGYHRPYKPDVPGHAISKEVRLSRVSYMQVSLKGLVKMFFCLFSYN